MSEDRGRTFTRVGPTSSSACADCKDMVGDFLALAYDVPGGYMYAGGHINGIARLDMRSAGARWQWINFNLLGPDLWQNETVIPRIEVRPLRRAQLPVVTAWLLMTAVVLAYLGCGSDRSQPSPARPGPGRPGHLSCLVAGCMKHHSFC